MKTLIKHIAIITGLLLASLQQQAQQLDVAMVNLSNNVMRITGTATAFDFTSSPNNFWTSMNLTWRIPKTVAMPAPTLTGPGTATPEVTAESTEFTGASPRNVFDSSLELSMFDAASLGAAEDGYWYFQLTGTTEAVQNIAMGSTITLYEFTLPAAWRCPGCVELLTTDDANLLSVGISTGSAIYNGTGNDVMNVVTNNANLPVQFLEFKATKGASNVQLQWTVTAEEQVKGYAIERSTDGVHWEQIGYSAARAPATVNRYSYTDASPATGRNYYRIRQQDNDGRYTLSVTRSVEWEAQPLGISAYPVPVQKTLSLRIESTAAANVTIIVTDMLGRPILQQRTSVRAGVNVQQVDMQTLKAGTYFIEVIHPKQKWTSKLVKE
jgi:hypothetical protein